MRETCTPRERLGGVLAASNPVVNLIGLGLVVLGLALLVATLAFWRSAIEDPEVLAPLEVMGERRYARSNDFERFEILNDVRPGGPMPIRITTAPPPAHEAGSGPIRRQREQREQYAPAVEADREDLSRIGNEREVAPEFDEPWDDEGDDNDVVVPPVIDPLINFQNKRRRD